MLKILIADDRNAMQKQVNAILESLGECHLAQDGQELVNLFMESRESGQGYDLVIMDVIMPRKDAYTAVQEIREFERNSQERPVRKTKVLVVTTSEDTTDLLIHRIEEGVDDYIARPYGREALMEAIGRLGLRLRGTN